MIFDFDRSSSEVSASVGPNDAAAGDVDADGGFSCRWYFFFPVGRLPMPVSSTLPLRILRSALSR